MTIKRNVQLPRSNREGVKPRADELDYGMLAVNFAAGDEFLSTKNSSNEVVVFPSKNYLEKHPFSNLTIDNLVVNSGASIKGNTTIDGSLRVNGDTYLGAKTYVKSGNNLVTIENLITETAKADGNDYITGGSAANNTISLTGKGSARATIAGVVTSDKVAEAVNSASNGKFVHTTGDTMSGHLKITGTSASDIASKTAEYGESSIKYQNKEIKYPINKEGTFAVLEQNSNGKTYLDLGAPITCVDNNVIEIPSLKTNQINIDNKTIKGIGNGLAVNENGIVSANDTKVSGISVASGNNAGKALILRNSDGTTVSADTTIWMTSGGEGADGNNYVTGGSAKNNTITLNRKDLTDTTIAGVVTTDKVAEEVKKASNWEAGQGNGAVLLKNSNGSAAGEFSVSEGKGNTASGENAHAEGNSTTASGGCSHAEGLFTTASGYCSHAEGSSTIASGYCSHAEGNSTKTRGESSHAEGKGANAIGNYSHAEGSGTTAIGNYSHAEGYKTKASGDASHAEGSGTTASGSCSHAEGLFTTASGSCSHAEGSGTNASGSCSHAEGFGTIANGEESHAEGNHTTASGHYSHAEGANTTAIGNSSHAEGLSTTASGGWSHAEGYSTTASGTASHAEGSGTIASGTCSHAEGYSTTASSNYSHAEGANTTASGTCSHAEGNHTTASGNDSHAEGSGTIASGHYSHAEGSGTTASGDCSHAEGDSTTASGFGSHAEGGFTSASGICSHAEGSGTIASGDYSHAEGNSTTASGHYSHAEGNGTIAMNEGEHACGIFNRSVLGSGQVLSVGAGTSDVNRVNSFYVKNDGTIGSDLDMSISGKSKMTLSTASDKLIMSGGTLTTNCTMTTGAHFTTSDERLKTNIIDVSEDEIEKAKKIDLKSFNLKRDGKKYFGVVAQEVETAGLSELVNTDSEGMKSVDYTSLLILKIAELEKEIKDLKNQINKN